MLIFRPFFVKEENGEMIEMQVFGVPPAEGAVKVFFVPLLLTFFFYIFARCMCFINKFIFQSLQIMRGMMHHRTQVKTLMLRQRLCVSSFEENL